MSKTLILAVVGQQAAQFGSRRHKAFEGQGGSIGRSDDCDWVLNASGVSRTHAMIRFLNGLYFVEDRSTNGMLLNGMALAKGEPSALNHGDRLQIDSFEVEVALRDGAAAEPDRTHVAPTPAPAPAPAPVSALPVHEAFDLDMLGPGPAPAHTSSLDNLIDGPGAVLPGGDLDPLSFLNAPLSSQPPVREAAASPGWNHSPGIEDHFRPPHASTQHQALPENWDLTMGDFASPPVAASPAAVTPAPAPAPAAASMPAELEQIFRIVVDGVMDVLRARAEIKNTFRLPVTIIQRSENNPLKFAATPEEAMQKIMAPPSAAFLAGSAAFDDAFDDIRCHQMAMLAGMRAAFDSLLFHFNPDRFERETDSAARRSAFSGKGRYWERYRENFDELSKDPDGCFRRLFGDEFARAYEAQLARLKSARRAAMAPTRR
ncbi:type VI secretion system-associated FHA domain protein TagH [Dyella japonica]|uniref:Peptide-binding protein n=1 Tax=Dyella japonica A8 TaxID=1217721 RepID=A0A075K2P9_9GAMM|nr:type VI secretion system-associated FHA domain protein TagH [Dyella japonica]AIF48225.1 peptide-binding protein [Dyella japonica A8]